MNETDDRAALIAQAKRMSLYVQRGGPDDGTVYDRLAVALVESERQIAEYAAVIKEIRKAWFGPCKFDEQDEEKISEILNRTAVTPD